MSLDGDDIYTELGVTCSGNITPVRSMERVLGGHNNSYFSWVAGDMNG